MNPEEVHMESDRLLTFFKKVFGREELAHTVSNEEELISSDGKTDIILCFPCLSDTI